MVLPAGRGRNNGRKTLRCRCYLAASFALATMPAMLAARNAVKSNALTIERGRVAYTADSAALIAGR
jgi:hypothetical protein